MNLSLILEEETEDKPAREESYKSLSEIPVWRFKYSSPDVSPNEPHDPTPHVIIFGLFEHFNTHNILVCGLNLNYMNRNQKKRFALYAKEIIEGSPDEKQGGGKRTLQDIWEAGKRLMPDVFGGGPYRSTRGAYRTYRKDRMDAIINKSDLPKWLDKMQVKPIRPEPGIKPKPIPKVKPEPPEPKEPKEKLKKPEEPERKPEEEPEEPERIEPEKPSPPEEAEETEEAEEAEAEKGPEGETAEDEFEPEPEPESDESGDVNIEW